MTVCNVCRVELDPRDQTGFLCRAHIGLVPAPLLAAYREACADVALHRKQQARTRHAGGAPAPTPRRLVGRLADTYRAAREAAVQAAQRSKR